jgi:hypothetical protein
MRVIPACRECESNGVKKWRHDGTAWFWSCPAYPDCRGRVDDYGALPPMRAHSNWGLRAQGLHNRGILFLFHFTHIANIAGVVQQGGLLSWAEQERRGALAVRPGGTSDSRSLARRNGDDDRISLSVAANTPMFAVRMRHDSQYAIFVVSPAAADAAGVLFTSTNATANEHWRAEPPKGFAAIDFTKATGPADWTDPDWKRAVQAEILVPVHIPLDLIVAIAFRSEQDLSSVPIGIPKPIQSIVEPDLFPEVW